MFTALVTFLVTVTMILGGAGSPVDVILDSLSTDLVYMWEVSPEEGEDPVEDPIEDPVEEKGNGPEARTGQQDDFEPVGPLDPEPAPDPSPFWEEDAEDAWPNPLPDPEPKREFGKGPYGGDSAPVPEEPEEAEAVDEEPIDEEEKAKGPQAGTGKPDEVVPDPQPDPNPAPEPEPAPDPAPNDCEEDDSCPAPAPEPQPEPEPEPVPNLGEGPVEPNPAPSPDCEEDSCPEPVPAPEQPATGGGEGDGNEAGGNEAGGSEIGENGKP